MRELWTCQNLSVVGDEAKRQVWIRYPWICERPPDAWMCCNSKSLLVLKAQRTWRKFAKKRTLTIRDVASQPNGEREAADFVVDKKCPLEKELAVQENWMFSEA